MHKEKKTSEQQQTKGLHLLPSNLITVHPNWIPLLHILVLEFSVLLVSHIHPNFLSNSILLFLKFLASNRYIQFLWRREKTRPWQANMQCRSRSLIRGMGEMLRVKKKQTNKKERQRVVANNRYNLRCPEKRSDQSGQACRWHIQSPIRGKDEEELRLKRNDEKSKTKRRRVAEK